METWQFFTFLISVCTLLSIAIWRFSRLETNIKHQAKCNRLVVKAVLRMRRTLNNHIKEIG